MTTGLLVVVTHMVTYSEGSLYKYSQETQSENTQLFATTRFQFGDLFAKFQFSYLEDFH